MVLVAAALVSTACSNAVNSGVMDGSAPVESAVVGEIVDETTIEGTNSALWGSETETEETTAEESTISGQQPETQETVPEETLEQKQGDGILIEGRPVGHQIHYTKGEETYGWTRYEYDENGRKIMNMFISPKGDEYWSPVFYDGNGHVIPEAVGDWTTLDENGLHLQVGTEDSRGRRTPMVEYAYDEKGNLTDYWYMYVDGSFQRHMVYQYDSRDHLIREELYYVRSDKLLSYVAYIYNSDDVLIRKNVVEDASQEDTVTYTIYQYDDRGLLTREEQIWGGMVHDYVEYTYSDDGVLLSEYHYLEDPMMGGAYTVEYLFELPDDSAG